MDDLVTFVIPAYNAEKFLAECLDSIRSQTYERWEAIVVDDGSTDSTAAIARSLAKADGRIRIWSRRNGGLSAARNSGIAAAKGRWLSFVDADDMIHPQFLKTLLEAAKTASAAIAACTQARGLEPQWQAEGKIPVPMALSGRRAFEDSLYQTGIDSSACGKIFDARLFDKARFTEGILYEDLDIFGRLCLQAETVAWVCTPMYFYRTNAESIVHTFSPARFDVLKVTEGIERRCASDPELLRAARDRRFAAAFNMLALASIAGHPAADDCWRLVKERRRQVLANPKSRLKNKAGALLSLLGRRLTVAILKIAYK